MAKHNALGKWGEQIAASHLALQDYHILEQNWRIGPLEIDIIAEYLGEIVFVEVKTRRTGDDRTAREAVDFHKRRHIIQAANAYIHIHDIDAHWRYDVITIVGEGERYALRHHRRAFDWRSQLR